MLTAADPLVPVPARAEDYVHEALVADPGAAVQVLLSRFLDEFAVRMSGFDSVGNPIVPPDSHVLDHLARAWDLVEPELAQHRPAATTVACPVEESECEICGSKARYDAPVVSRGQRFRVELCIDCMRQHGDPSLGASGSVYLMYFDEIPAAVRAVCDEICAREGRGSIWGSPTPEPAAGESTSTTTGSAAASVTRPLGVSAVAVRMRRLWLDEFGPAFDEQDHDLAGVWRECEVHRSGPDMVVTGQIDFGVGDPFADQFSRSLATRLTERTEGAVRTLRYEHSERQPKVLRRANTSNVDVFHPADLTADVDKTLRALASRLTMTTGGARTALSRLHLAGVSKHRMWFAVASAEHKSDIGSTPGAASELAMAVGDVQRKEPLFDVVVDPETSHYLLRTALVQEGR